jgi:hypothetical protein
MFKLKSNYIKGFVQESQKPVKFFLVKIFLLNVSESKIGRLGRLGLCVCQTKNPMQCWVQQLVFYIIKEFVQPKMSLNREFLIWKEQGRRCEWVGGSAGSHIDGKVRFGRDIETKRQS